MADDLDLLTAPVAKGKSLVKKLRNEAKNSRKAPERPYLYPESGTSQGSYSLGGTEPLPLRVMMSGEEPLPHSGMGSEEPLNHGTSAGRRRNRRSYKRAMYGEYSDSVELRELNSQNMSTAGSDMDSGQFVNRPSSSQGVVHRPNETTQYSKINRVHLPPSQSTQVSRLRQNGDMSHKSVRWSGQSSSQFDHSDRLSVTTDRSHDRSGLSDASVTRGRRFSERYLESNEDQVNPDDPWTVYNSGRDTYFVYGASLRANNPPEEHPGWCGWWDDMWAPYGGFRKITSPWIFASLTLLFIANIFFMTAFVTNHWGILHVLPATGQPVSQGHNRLPEQSLADNRVMKYNDTSLRQWIWNAWNGIPNPVYYESIVPPEVGLPETGPADGVIPEAEDKKTKHVVNRMNTDPKASEYWQFGLWQCCRNTDKLCLGPKFTTFYTVTRSLCVLSLFLMILTFAWLLGHTLEKLMDYDTCTMSTLISMCLTASIFTMVAVIAFGVRWPIEFGEEYDGTDPELSYSFYMACFSIPLTVGAAACSIIDLKTGLAEIKANEKFYSDPDNFSDVTMSDIPTDNISRPKHQKKKRTGHGQSPYVYESQA